MTSPTSVELPLKIATRAQPAAAGPQTIAFVVSPDMPDDAVEVIADLTRAVRRELAGGGR